MFAAMAEDASGGVVFFGGYGQQDRQGTVLDPNENADQADTWTYYDARVTVPVEPPNPPGPPNDYAIEVSIAPPSEINANGESTITATAKATRFGIADPGRQVRFTTDGDVTFSPVIDNGDGTYTSTITASRTPGIETISAHHENWQWGGSAALVERGITVSLEPSWLPPDKNSTSRATPWP
jgi:hypothetical protein